METHHLISNATHPLREAPLWGSRWERARVRIKLTKRQIEVTLFAVGVETLEGLKDGKLVRH
jgi:hypothetical protein